MFEPADYLRLAHELAREAVRESPSKRGARVRTAYGRAYYGLFLIVREAIVRRHRLSARKLSHGALYTRLQHSTLDHRLRLLGREMERLYAFRRKADYELAPGGEWEEQLKDPDVAQVFAKRALEFANTVPHLDFTPIVHLF